MPNFVSILMLTHNAPEYVEISIRSLAEKTKGVNYELVVIDNGSDEPTRELLARLTRSGLIHHLELLGRNSLFAEGNNIASRHASAHATHYLLLNSDVRINSADWLTHLLKVHSRGITAYGFVQNPARVDGYCLLIDADLYNRHRLDESHQWWWSVTKLQAQILADGFSVQGYSKHEKYIHHFGGKSGDAFKSAHGMNVTRAEVESWFSGTFPVQLDRGMFPDWRSTFIRMKRLAGQAIRKALGIAVN